MVAQIDPTPCKKRVLLAKSASALNCWQQCNHTFQPQQVPRALTASKAAASEDQKQFPDTGASAHVTSNPGNLII